MAAGVAPLSCDGPLVMWSGPSTPRHPDKAAAWASVIPSRVLPECCHCQNGLLGTGNRAGMNLIHQSLAMELATSLWHFHLFLLSNLLTVMPPLRKQELLLDFNMLINLFAYVYCQLRIFGKICSRPTVFYQQWVW